LPWWGVQKAQLLGLGWWLLKKWNPLFAVQSYKCWTKKQNFFQGKYQQIIILENFYGRL